MTRRRSMRGIYLSIFPNKKYGLQVRGLGSGGSFAGSPHTGQAFWLWEGGGTTALLGEGDSEATPLAQERMAPRPIPRQPTQIYLSVLTSLTNLPLGARPGLLLKPEARNN